MGLDAPTRIHITARIREVAAKLGLDPEDAVRGALRLLRTVWLKDLATTLERLEDFYSGLVP